MQGRQDSPILRHDIKEVTGLSRILDEQLDTFPLQVESGFFWNAHHTIIACPDNYYLRSVCLHSLTNVRNLQQMSLFPNPAGYCSLPNEYNVLRVDNPVYRNSTEIIGVDQFFQTTLNGLQIVGNTNA